MTTGKIQAIDFLAKWNGPYLKGKILFSASKELDLLLVPSGAKYIKI
jgi:hypothetical protein